MHFNIYLRFINYLILVSLRLPSKTQEGQAKHLQILITIHIVMSITNA